MVRLKSFMTSTFVTICSFASLLVALFCSDIYAFLGARTLVVSLQICVYSAASLSSLELPPIS